MWDFYEETGFIIVLFLASSGTSNTVCDKFSRPEAIRFIRFGNREDWRLPFVAPVQVTSPQIQVMSNLGSFRLQKLTNSSRKPIMTT